MNNNIFENSDIVTSFIKKNNKIDHFEQKLQDALLICLKNYDNKYNSLKYTYKNIAYNIEFRNIIKIELLNIVLQEHLKIY